MDNSPGTFTSISHVNSHNNPRSRSSLTSWRLYSPPRFATTEGQHPSVFFGQEARPADPCPPPWGFGEILDERGAEANENAIIGTELARLREQLPFLEPNPRPFEELIEPLPQEGYDQYFNTLEFTEGLLDEDFFPAEEEEGEEVPIETYLRPPQPRLPDYSQELHYGEPTSDSRRSQPAPASVDFGLDFSDITGDRPPIPPFHSRYLSSTLGSIDPIDLTRSSPDADMAPTTRKRGAESFASASNGDFNDSPATKRRRTSASGASSSKPSGRLIPHIDLSGDDDKENGLRQKQLEEQVAAQGQAQTDTSGSKKQSRLTSLQCNVCLESPTDLTATVCGHTFCRSCLLDWIVSAERDPARRPTCPTCRRNLQRNAPKTKKDIVPLVFMRRAGPA